MSRTYFGTDGIRGRVGQFPITPDFVLKLGYCAGKVLSRADIAPPHRDRPAVLIGKDTRISGYMLESALESGLSAAGLDPKTRAVVFNTIRAMNQAGHTLLLVEQNARSGLGIATHGVVMESGRIRLEGPGPEVLNNPEIGRLYLGAA